MGKGKTLSEGEKAKIEVLKEEGYSNRQIAEKIGRGKTVIGSFINNIENYGRNRKGRIVEATTPADKRAIIRSASNSCLSASKIKAKTGVQASLSTVRRVTNKTTHLKLKKLQKKPPLNATRKANRLEFSKNHMSWKQEWNRVTFSDEKKFNLDGPDGHQFYFHDLRKEEKYLNRNHSRQGSVMVWGAISYYGTIDLVFPSTRMTALSYKAILENAFPKFKELFGPLQWIYQQDNAPIHTARLIADWIKDEGVSLLPWPPYSPDLNIMENVWGWLLREVYGGGKQYEDKHALITAIKMAWDKITLIYLKALYDSMPSRIFETICAKGGSTHY